MYKDPEPWNVKLSGSQQCKAVTVCRPLMYNLIVLRSTTHVGNEGKTERSGWVKQGQTG